MIVHEIVSLLEPFRHALETRGFNVSYRCLELSDEGIRCKTSHVCMDVSCDLEITGYTGPIHVDGPVFITIVKSLPENKELELFFDNGALFWTCGATKGKLACVAVPDIFMDGYLSLHECDYQPSVDFLQALSLGSISGDSVTMAAVGMGGVMIDTTRRLCASTDDATISTAWFRSPMPKDAPKRITLSQETIPVIAGTMSDVGYWEVTDKVVRYSDSNTSLIVSQVEPLSKYDTVINLIEKCRLGKIVAPLPGDTIRGFIKRAGALSHNRGQLSVGLRIKDDRITLEFDEIASKTEEYFTVKGLAVTDEIRVKLNAAKLARGMKYASEMVLDFLPHILVLRTRDGGFQYLMSGR